MTAPEAIAGLAAIVGPVGVAGILVAYFGYKAQAGKGRPDASIPPITVSAGAVAGKDVELLANALTQLEAGLTRLALLWEFHHVEIAGRHDEYEDWAERKILHAEIAALKAKRLRGE